MLDMDKRSQIKNLCPWAVSFRLPNSHGEVFLEANQKQAINNAELVTLIENNNVLFCGTGNGNHARIYVENEELRKYVGFESDDGKIKQFVLTDEECQRIFDYKTFATFKKHIEEEVIANHEKHKIMEYARKIKLNDFDKIDFLQTYCELKFKE
jgi:hypothetical protein